LVIPDAMQGKENWNQTWRAEQLDSSSNKEAHKRTYVTSNFSRSHVSGCFGKLWNCRCESKNVSSSFSSDHRPWTRGILEIYSTAFYRRIARGNLVRRSACPRASASTLGEKLWSISVSTLERILVLDHNSDADDLEEHHLHHHRSAYWISADRSLISLFSETLYNKKRGT
jgi:hypothetical protein